MPQVLQKYHSFSIGDLVAITYLNGEDIIKIEEARIQAVADDCIKVRFCNRRLLRPTIKWVSVVDNSLRLSKCQEV